jgi:putative ABC transport system ATP-binding protein
MSNGDSSVIQVTALRKSITNGAHTVDILKGVDFSVPRGQFIAIMGPSGSGKSTLLGLLAGLDNASSGSITLTAIENILLPHELSGAGDGLPRAQQLIESVGLQDRADHYPVQLSGGEQQRVALARAFMARPPILMADEPTGNLDSANGAHVLDLLLNLNRREGTTLVLVTHDAALATHADRVIQLKDGLVVGDERRA